MNNTRRLLLAFTIILSSLLLVAGQDENAKFEKFFREYLDQSFALQPVSATQLGEHRFDSQMEDLSAAGRAKWLALDRQTLEALPRQVQRAKLSDSTRLDYDIFQDELQRSIWLTENFHPFETDPRIYNGYLSDSVYVQLTQSTLPQEVNVSNSIARMAHIPAVIAAAKANLKNPPRVFLETAIRQNQGSVGFYEKDIFEFAGKTTELDKLRPAAERAAAALKEYQRFLEQDLLPRANGEWRIGKERFYRKLEMTLNAGMTADEVLADAQAEFDRVQRDMYVVSRQLWSRYFPKAVLPPDDTAGRRETIQRVVAAVGREHGKPETLVADVRETVAKIKTFIAERDILRLPEPDTCQTVEMPEFKRGNSTAYMQSPPPLDPKAVGFFAVSPPPSDWDERRVNTYLEEYNQHMNQILTIHEAYPGHYVQLEYANRNPSLVRKVLGSGVYVEGWAVYTEQMMLDQGYGDGDLRLRLNQLKFYLRAVANTILDHNMHCTQFTDDEALAFLTQDAYQSEGEARLKIIRAKQSSTQLSTYFVGRMAMYRLRQAVQRELGDKFELGRYHEAVLAPGPVPVKYLPGLVRARLQQPR